MKKKKEETDRRLQKTFKEVVMGGRYVVTGSQLGMICGIDNPELREKVIEGIIDKQYIGHSNETIEKDIPKFDRIFPLENET